jgi:sugar phosphate permease
MDYKKKRWIMLVVLFLAYWLTFFNRSLTTPTLPLLIKEWGLGMGAAGMLASIMLITYSVGHIPFGVLSDKYGRAKFLVFGTVTVGVFNVILSFTQSFFSFAAVRGIIGLGAAANHAPLMALVNDWFPLSKRAFAMSALSMVTTVAPLTCLLWGKSIIAQYGTWQPVYYFTAIPAIVITILCLVYVRDITAKEKEQVFAEEMEDRRKVGITDPPAQAQHFTWRAAAMTFKDATLWWLYIAWFMVVFEFFILIHFLPTLLIKIHGVKLADAIFMTTGWLWTGLFVSLLGGWISDKIKHRKWFVILVVTPAHLLVISIAYLPVEMIFPVLCVMGIFWFGTSGAFYAWSAEIAHKEYAGLIATILAVCVLFGDLGGALGTGISGYLADRLGLLSMFWVAGGAGILMNVAMIFLPDTFKTVAK